VFVGKTHYCFVDCYVEWSILFFYLHFQSEAGTAKHFLQIIDNAESDYQVFQPIHSHVCYILMINEFFKQQERLTRMKKYTICSAKELLVEFELLNKYFLRTKGYSSLI